MYFLNTMQIQKNALLLLKIHSCTLLSVAASGKITYRNSSRRSINHVKPWNLIRNTIYLNHTLL